MKKGLVVLFLSFWFGLAGLNKITKLKKSSDIYGSYLSVVDDLAANLFFVGLIASNNELIRLSQVRHLQAEIAGDFDRTLSPSVSLEKKGRPLPKKG